MTALVRAGVSLLPWLWGLTVLVAGAGRRAAPSRLSSLASPSAASPPGTGSERGGADVVAASVTAIGGHLRRLAGRPADVLLDRRLGWAVATAAPVVLIGPAAAGAVGATVWCWPLLQRRREERRRESRLVTELPEVLDLLLLAVGAGLTVPLAVAAVGRRSSGPIAAELRRVSGEVRLGRRTADVLDELPARLGEGVRPLVATLVASERYGAPLEAALERLVADARDDRRRRAEEAARKVPVKLLFPLVLCTLPAFALLTVAPLIAGAAHDLRP